MRRKIFWVALCALLFTASVRVQAQQPKKIPRVGYLAAVSAAADAPRLEAFRQGLRELGYIEGQNILIDYRHEGRSFERSFPTLPPSWSVLKLTCWSRSQPMLLSLPRKLRDRSYRVHGRDGSDYRWAGRNSGATWRKHHRHHQHGGDFDRQTIGAAQGNSFPRSAALPCCGILRLRARHRNGTKANCRRGNWACNFIRCR